MEGGIISSTSATVLMVTLSSRILYVSLAGQRRRLLLGAAKRSLNPRTSRAVDEVVARAGVSICQA